MRFELDGRAAIVTGASRGLGFAAVCALAEEGVGVLAAARTQSSLDELARLHPERVVPAAYDARDPDAADALVATALAAFGKLDVLVNNAGVAPASPFVDDDMSTWRETLEVNVMGPVSLTQAAGRHMIERRSGKVINVASLTGLRGKARLSAYSASKGALIRFTEAVAAEWARHNVQVNAIAPGAFRTEAQREVLESEELHRRRVARIPAKRFAEPSEMNGLLCFLASPLSDFVTGASYVIDGGELAKL